MKRRIGKGLEPLLEEQTFEIAADQNSEIIRRGDIFFFGGKTWIATELSIAGDLVSSYLMPTDCTLP